MDELIKITDLTGRYNISARALRYYEDMGLINSVRSGEYAFRMYDGQAVKRLEQVLILRKLNVGIKDIRRVFSSSGTDAVLEVLGKKINDIDEEVALLHELKSIVVEFIRQIKQADFSKDSDVKLLYEKAKEIETQLTGAEYNGNPSPAHRLNEIADKLEEKAVSRLTIPDNILKRLLHNVYFILGDGAEAADELSRRYGIFVYHTCDHRSKHSQNADPRYQPGLCRFEENIPDYFSQDPEYAMTREREIVHDYTPMVIMDLIQLAAAHERVICENDIDIESILPIVTNAIMISNSTGLDGFIGRFEDNIRGRAVSDGEKERLIAKVKAVWGNGKPENPRDINPYGIKQIFTDSGSAASHTADIIADYFNFQ